jgi:deoxyadenosine/deoxycytidine kinase
MSLIISIDGNIGSGKSTLVNNLKKELDELNKYIFLEEPIDEWNKIKNDNITILEKFYSDQEKYGFSFQMMAYITRLKNLKDAIKKNPNAIIITERSLYTDKYIFATMLYNNKKINTFEYQIYNKWFNEFLKELPTHKFIFLSTKPENALKRIKERNRSGEENIDINYLKECEYYHNKMYEENIDNVLMKINIDEHLLGTSNYNLLIDDIIYNIEQPINNLYLIVPLCFMTLSYILKL